MTPSTEKANMSDKTNLKAQNNYFFFFSGQGELRANFNCFS